GRFAFPAGALAAAAILFFATPKLAAFVMARDSPVLPGVRTFTMRAGACPIRCELSSGDVTGMAPGWTRLQTPARVTCALPVLEPSDRLALRIEGPGRSTKVLVDGNEVIPVPTVNGAPEILLSPQVSTVTIENFAPPAAREPIVFSFDPRP